MLRFMMDMPEPNFNEEDLVVRFIHSENEIDRVKYENVIDNGYHWWGRGTLGFSVLRFSMFS